MEGIALQIRNQIFEKTGCTASAGIGIPLFASFLCFVMNVDIYFHIQNK